MIDLLQIRIYLKSQFITELFDKDGILRGGECAPDIITEYGFSLAAGCVEKSDDPKNPHYEVGRLYHPFESLPSSNSTLAFKFKFGGKNYFPHVEIKASPAKLLQGHDAFGSTDFMNGVNALMYTFWTAFPFVDDLLEISSSELYQIDSTYSAKMKSMFECKQVITALSSVSTGKVKNTKSFESTASWSYGSEYSAKIAYLKEVEVNRQLQELKVKMKTQKHEYLTKQLSALQSEEVQSFVKNVIRFEAKIKRKWLKENGIPTRLIDLKKFIGDRSAEFCEWLWHKNFDPIFETFKGHNMNMQNDEKIFRECKIVFDKYREVNGKTVVVETKSRNVYQFYLSCKAQGLEFMKGITSSSGFYRNYSDLGQVLSKAQIQNLHTQNSVVIPLIKVINIDFSNQRPASFREINPNVLAVVGA